VEAKKATTVGHHGWNDDLEDQHVCLQRQQPRLSVAQAIAEQPGQAWDSTQQPPPPKCMPHARRGEPTPTSGGLLGLSRPLLALVATTLAEHSMFPALAALRLVNRAWAQVTAHVSAEQFITRVHTHGQCAQAWRARRAMAPLTARGDTQLIEALCEEISIKLESKHGTENLRLYTERVIAHFDGSIDMVHTLSWSTPAPGNDAAAVGLMRVIADCHNACTIPGTTFWDRTPVSAGNVRLLTQAIKALEWVTSFRREEGYAGITQVLARLVALTLQARSPSPAVPVRHHYFDDWAIGGYSPEGSAIRGLVHAALHALAKLAPLSQGGAHSPDVAEALKEGGRALNVRFQEEKGWRTEARFRRAQYNPRAAKTATRANMEEPKRIGLEDIGGYVDDQNAEQMERLAREEEATCYYLDPERPLNGPKLSASYTDYCIYRHTQRSGWWSR